MAEDLKPKRVKEPKTKTPAPAPNPAGPGMYGMPEKRTHPVRNTLLFTSLFFAVLIVGVIAVCRAGGYDESGEYVYWLDPEGYIRGPVLLFLNPEEADRESYYAAEIEDVFERDAELQEREDELDKWEENLDERESRLDEREDALAAREDLVEEWIEAIIEKGPQGNANTNDIMGVAKQIAAMSPKKAALMLTDMDDEYIYRLLSVMKPAEAAKILDNMEADRAAEIVELVFDEDYDSWDMPDTRPGPYAPAEPTPPPVMEETDPADEELNPDSETNETV